LLKALKPLAFKGNSTRLTGTTSTTLISTTPASVIASGIINNGISKTDIKADPYKLNKLNARKPGFIKDGEIIIGYKFKYFRKGNKKGQIYSKQLFVAIKLQACPYIKVLPCKDFTKNIVNAYLNYAYAIKVNKRTKKN
jgi:deoxycytidylate deaminase